MNRQEKQDLVATLSGMYEANQFVFLVQMNAVNASNALKFRAKIRHNNASCVLAKNTLSKIAAKEAGLEIMNSNFSKQVLTVFTNNPVEVAKLFEEYADKGYSVIAGSDKKTAFTPADVKKLAKVPAMPVLRSMLLSTILGVHTKIARVLSERQASLESEIAPKN